MLIGREQEVTNRLAATQGAMERRPHDVAELLSQIEHLRRQHEQLVLAYNSVITGKTWRLRTLVLRILERIGTLAAQPLRSLRGRR